MTHEPDTIHVISADYIRLPRIISSPEESKGYDENNVPPEIKESFKNVKSYIWDKVMGEEVIRRVDHSDGAQYFIYEDLRPAFGRLLYNPDLFEYFSKFQKSVGSTVPVADFFPRWKRIETGTGQTTFLIPETEEFYMSLCITPKYHKSAEADCTCDFRVKRIRPSDRVLMSPVPVFRIKYNG